MTTTAQQTELEKAATRVIYFAEFSFKTATQRVSTWNQTITWGGHEWGGLGAFGSISAVEESDGLEAKPLNFTLNIAQPSLLAIAIGYVEEYRDRDAKLYMCPLNEQFQLIDTPEVCWRGTMDTVSVGVEGEEGQIILRCETSAHGLKRLPALRINHEQQRQRYLADEGLKYLTGLIANPQLWLSKKFQSI